MDFEMLSALDNHAVDLLVTEDGRLRDHADAADLGSQTLSILGAVEYLKRLFGQPVALPTVHARQAYVLSSDDPIFETLREGYDDFDGWWKKASNEHRDCRTIEGPTGELEALAVLKPESDHPYGLPAPVLKLCTFKVAPEAEGAKRGELILKSVFHHATEHHLDYIYVTVFDEHVGLVSLLESFGFSPLDKRTDRGERIMVKRLRPPTDIGDCSPLDYNRLYGPGAVIIDHACVIPIQPRWHDVLFPEDRFQGRLLPEEPSGNAMLKAYLCRAPIRTLSSGDLVVFYRSGDQRASVIGVVERTLTTDDPVEVRRFVSTRTVYTDEEIANMCAQGVVLAILFRQDRVLSPPWSLELMKKHHVLNAAPQAAQQADDERGLQWLRSQLNDPR
ncbi:MAG: GNAT family N-acetyltransferase [Acidimicrobiales bacterium]